MKFALYYHVPWPEGRDQSQIFQELSEEIELGDQLGFKSAWVAEHHFTRHGLGSSSLILISNIAARTKQIRFGTAVIVTPLHHPIKLAEDTATLDRVTGGRLDVGFGRGSARYEYRGYDVDQEESPRRFQEAVRIVQGLWTTPDFSYEGEFFKVNHATLVPTPLQQPQPPVYIAANRTPASMQFLAEQGHTLLVGQTLDLPDAYDLCNRFLKLSATAGTNVPASRIPFFRYFYVAPTEKQAREDTRASIEWVVDMLQWRATIAEGSEVGQHLDDWRRTRPSLPVSYEHVFENRAFFGTPDQCIAKIKEVQKFGIDYFGCNFAFGGMDHAKTMRSMELFAKEVMPAFA